MATQPQILSQNSSLRAYLQQELLRRCNKNNGYSLRSFARALRVNPASLSRIIRGERAISVLMFEKLTRALGLTQEELLTFEVPSKTGRKGRNPAPFAELSDEVFAVISDWFHFAILELTRVQGFESDTRWIAKTLNLSKQEAQNAVDRLFKLGLMKVGANGSWVNASGNTTNVSADLRSLAHLRLQRQLLGLALQSLDRTPIQERDSSGMTMAIRASRLPEAIEKITKFRRELSEFLEEPPQDRVYQLVISLFPLSDTQ